MKRGTLIFWSTFAVAASIRIIMSFHHDAPPAEDCLKRLDRGVGVIAADPARNETGQILLIAADRIFPGATSTEPCAAKITVRAKTKLYPRFSYGQRVAFTGRLSRPFNFSSDNGRVFDYSGYLAKDDIFYEMKSAVVSLEDEGRASLTSALFSLKRRFVGNLESVLGEPHAALAAGLVVGEKSALGSDLLDDFRKAGLIHIVVLSGFNITIVGVALRRIFSFLPRVWGIFLGGAAIALFGILVGGGATVIRSCFMAGVALIADLIRRDYSISRALAFAGLLMLIDNPSVLLHDASFQLSFLAVIGLLLLAGPIESRLGFLPDIFGVRSTVSACLATQIFVSPFILYMMGQISIVGVVVNILVLPFIPMTMLSVFLTGATGFISSGISAVLGWGTHFLLSYELFMVQSFAGLPFAAIEMPPFPFWVVAAFYAAFVAAYVSVSCWRPKLLRPS